MSNYRVAPMDATMLMEKPLPPATWSNLLPPNLDYEYFAASRLFPFCHTATAFEPTNAWWLAELSLLAYAMADLQRDRLREAGFPGFRFLATENVDCALAIRADCVLVAFRGTEWDDPRDYLTDLDVALVPFRGGGRVHRGFMRAFERIWGAGGLDRRLRELTGNGPTARPVWFTGHSLGAALATLAAATFQGASGLFTFGSPRVGDGVFKRTLRVNTWRVVNNNDAVARVPPDPPYVHVGKLHYINRQGRWLHKPRRRDRVADALLGNLTHLEAVLRRRRSGVYGEVIDDSLADHAPLHYAIHAWNHLVRSGFDDPPSGAR